MASALSHDILYLIFEHLTPYYDDLEYISVKRNLLACVNVCKTWESAAKSQLYRDIIAREPINPDPIRAISRQELAQLLQDRLPADGSSNDVDVSSSVSMPQEHQHDSDPHDIHPVDDLIPWQISSLLRCLQMSPENGDFVRNLSFDHYEGLRLLTYTSRLTGLFFGNYRDPVPMSSVLHDWLPPTLPALKALHLEQVPPKFIRALLSVSYVLTSCTIFLSGLYDDGRWSDWILPCEGLKNLIIEMEGVPSEQALLSLVNGCSDSLEYLRLEIIDETMLISNDDEESKWLDGWLPGKFASLESVRLRNISQASCGRIMALAASGLLRATLFPRDRLTKEWLKRLPESLRNVQLITQDFAETASDLVDLLDARPAWLPNLAYIPHIVSDMDEDEPVEGQATWQDAIGQAWMRRRALGI